MRLVLPRQKPLTWWLAIFLAGSLATPSFALPPLRRYTFERPSYGGLNRNIADDYLVKSGGLWHLFYTNLYMPAEPVVYIGHATSPDLTDWTEHAPVLVASPSEPWWRTQSVWAPMVTDRPGGGWVMAYTGVGDTGAQRLGFLTSDDLETWTPLPPDSAFEPDTTIYAWSATTWSSCRDPHLVRINNVWHLLYAARAADGRPSVGWAESPDLVTWTQHAPLLAQEGAGWSWPDLESPGITFFGGKTYLYYSWMGCRIEQGDSLASDWVNAPLSLIETFSSAPELQTSGSGLLMSRRRLSSCNTYQTYLWFDSLKTTTWPFTIVPRPALPGFTNLDGSAFTAQPSFGDGQATRGETPAAPAGLYWLSSREYWPEPAPQYECAEEMGAAQTGAMRSDAFVLNGDSVAVRVQGANSPDSAYVLLRDDCSGQTMARFSGGTPDLATKSAYVGFGRGRTVSWRITDGLTRPEGWIGTDNLEERASDGLANPPTSPTLTWVAPVGGESLQKNKAFRIRWTLNGGGTVDSLILYLVDSTGDGLKRQMSIPVSNTNINWTTPDTLLYTARLRLVAYAHSGAWGCNTSNTFAIGATTDASAFAATGGLWARYDARGAWLEGQTSPDLEDEAVLELFDIRGRRVAEPWRGRPASSFRVAVTRAIDGTSLKPGVYFARLRQGPLLWQARAVLLRHGD